MNLIANINYSTDLAQISICFRIDLFIFFILKKKKIEQIARLALYKTTYFSFLMHPILHQYVLEYQ